MYDKGPESATLGPASSIRRSSDQPPLLQARVWLPQRSVLTHVIFGIRVLRAHRLTVATNTLLCKTIHREVLLYFPENLKLIPGNYFDLSAWTRALNSTYCLSEKPAQTAAGGPGLKSNTLPGGRGHATKVAVYTENVAGTWASRKSWLFLERWASPLMAGLSSETRFFSAGTCRRSSRRNYATRFTVGFLGSLNRRHPVTLLIAQSGRLGPGLLAETCRPPLAIGRPSESEVGARSDLTLLPRPRCGPGVRDARRRANGVHPMSAHRHIEE